MPPLDDLIAKELPSVTEVRHDLHAHPELAYEEFRTADLVKSELERLGIRHVGGLAGGTGILGILPRTESGGKTIALRADMDALPIFEETDLPYKSTIDGKMHACGHDGHTAILLGVTRVLNQLSRPNDVLLVFQPAEENGAGGSKMVRDGVLDGSVLGEPVDLMFGLHGHPLHQVGEIATRVGPMMAAADQFKIVVQGKGCHAAMPHLGIDPIVIAAHIVSALQTVSSRSVSALDSVVVTIGAIHSGTATNIIPASAEMVGTMRTLKAEVAALAEARIRALAQGIAAAFGATVDISFDYGYPVTVNHPEAVRAWRQAVGNGEISGYVEAEIEPTMGAEDFSFYGQKVPACFYWLGLRNVTQDTYPNLHASNFDFNDQAIPVGMKAMCKLALEA